ncbi:MAG: tRNA 2-thiouridine(34) synthase MnmA, partial [Bacteroidetes bacterium]|nr:tRNA 2-thiouridine(34) synthase MnmA [Bacteroidota bacterium]
IHYVLPHHVLIEDDIAFYDVRIRYRQPLQTARLIKKPEGLYILFDQIQKGITPGQFAAWYKGDQLIGSGVIAH